MSSAYLRIRPFWLEQTRLCDRARRSVSASPRHRATRATQAMRLSHAPRGGAACGARRRAAERGPRPAHQLRPPLAWSLLWLFQTAANPMAASGGGQASESQRVRSGGKRARMRLGQNLARDLGSARAAERINGRTAAMLCIITAGAAPKSTSRVQSSTSALRACTTIAGADLVSGRRCVRHRLITRHRRRRRVGGHHSLQRGDALAQLGLLVRRRAACRLRRSAARGHASAPCETRMMLAIWPDTAPGAQSCRRSAAERGARTGSCCFSASSVGPVCEP